MYVKSYTFTDADNIKHTISAGHPALAAHKNTLKCAARMSMWGTAILACLAVGTLAALLTGSWLWLVYGIACFTPIPKVLPRYSMTAVGAGLIYLSGFGFIATCLVILPFVCSLLMQASARRMQANLLTVQQRIEASRIA